MELSERERRLLQEMESHLLVEDPRLASSLSIHRLRVGTQAVLATSGVVLGIVLMAVGVIHGRAVGIIVALVGFVVLLGSTSVVAGGLRARRESRAPAAGKPQSKT